MATKKKYHHYVLVFTNEGPKFVTSLGDHHTAYWNELESPKEFSKEYADDVVFGLRCNFFSAVRVTTPVELDNQPYLYDRGKFDFVFNNEPSREDIVAWISEHPQLLEDFKQKFPKYEIEEEEE